MRQDNPRVEVANLTTGAILNANLVQINGSVRANDFHFNGIDVDPVNHKLYWTSSATVTAVNGTLEQPDLQAPPSRPARPRPSAPQALYSAGTDNNRRCSPLRSTSPTASTMRAFS